MQESGIKLPTQYGFLAPQFTNVIDQHQILTRFKHGRLRVGHSVCLCNIGGKHSLGRKIEDNHFDMNVERLILQMRQLGQGTPPQYTK